jgi:FixJ family two-component response regulator
MLGLAGQGASGALAKAISLAKTLMGMSGEGDVEDVVKATKAIATDPLKDAAAKAAVKAAVQQADAYLAQTGDHAGALRTYATAIGKSEQLASAGANLAKGVNFAGAVADYAKKTNSLFDLIQEWLDHNEEANRAQTQMDDINRRMDELQKRIDACRHASGAIRRDAQLAAFYAAPAAGSGDPAAIQVRLAATRARLEAIPSQLETAAPWLLPFFADAPMSPRLAAALLSKAIPELETVKKTIDDAVAEGESMEKDLQQAIPPKPGAVKGGGAATGR